MYDYYQLLTVDLVVEKVNMTAVEAKNQMAINLYHDLKAESRLNALVSIYDAIFDWTWYICHYPCSYHISSRSVTVDFFSDLFASHSLTAKEIEILMQQVSWGVDLACILCSFVRSHLLFLVHHLSSALERENDPTLDPGCLPLRSAGCRIVKTHNFASETASDSLNGIQLVLGFLNRNDSLLYVLESANGSDCVHALESRSNCVRTADRLDVGDHNDSSAPSQGL
jgi:hypothetical protein